MHPLTLPSAFFVSTIVPMTVTSSRAILDTLAAGAAVAAGFAAFSTAPTVGATTNTVTANAARINIVILVVFILRPSFRCAVQGRFFAPCYKHRRLFTTSSNLNRHPSQYACLGISFQALAAPSPVLMSGGYDSKSFFFRTNSSLSISPFA
jgi:hypothetical protein